ncbi:MAG: undecaprenyl/decaprenyl-phosphate alpha-N-acetylglucosaminyl 1-phosphate transferase [Candidatus Omnitrophica bacterium]|nr:undecaprenyl/decaprenyl-phosphate alpha-N-acetylglucosaminyl 1-phosphate transferase [Candidatus Omnitrophota bacterium]MBU4478277.1 undecaprenyl/decaprenyl-phosphate alpha-N-acetylglucosaminyl 1-phosphate transferase [Candidatus Omnitrophota bacterium]MCG2703345.1 undecaprenyl/decaprenyl-phosphate alpha-N-acetylglucosaminyl 1-phosphate transferase [Candidatus Omnitrophota bacterium]
MIHLKTYLIILIISALTSYISTFVVRKIALKKHYVDSPSKRKVHVRPVPTLGGIALFLGFYLGMAAAFIFVPGLRYDFFLPFCGFSLAVLIILMTGIYDDLHDMKAQIKLVIQLLAAIIVVSFGFEINIITKPLGGSLPLGALSMAITVLWIVGMVNAINLLDGLDGLAAGVSGIAVFFLFIAALEMKIIPVAVLCLCLMGAIIGFLPHNFFPARIFMGNTGSMFIGLVLSVIALAGFQKRTALFTLFVPLMAMAVPIMDTCLSIIRRFLQKKPVFTADKEHIHHRILREEKTQVRVVLLLYFLTFCFGLIALSFARLNGVYAVLGLILVILTTFKWLRDWGFLEFK